MWLTLKGIESKIELPVWRYLHLISLSMYMFKMNYLLSQNTLPSWCWSWERGESAVVESVTYRSPPINGCFYITSKIIRYRLSFRSCNLFFMEIWYSQILGHSDFGLGRDWLMGPPLIRCPSPDHPPWSSRSSVAAAQTSVSAVSPVLRSSTADFSVSGHEREMKLLSPRTWKGLAFLSLCLPLTAHGGASGHQVAAAAPLWTACHC